MKRKWSRETALPLVAERSCKLVGPFMWLDRRVDSVEHVASLDLGEMVQVDSLEGSNPEAKHYRVGT